MNHLKWMLLLSSPRFVPCLPVPIFLFLTFYFSSIALQGLDTPSARPSAVQLPVDPELRSILAVVYKHRLLHSSATLGWAVNWSHLTEHCVSHHRQAECVETRRNSHTYFHAWLWIRQLRAVRRTGFPTPKSHFKPSSPSAIENDPLRMYPCSNRPIRSHRPLTALSAAA